LKFSFISWRSWRNCSRSKLVTFSFRHFSAARIADHYGLGGSSRAQARPPLTIT
jgi:hypothetical protein